MNIDNDRLGEALVLLLMTGICIGLMATIAFVGWVIALVLGHG